VEYQSVIFKDWVAGNAFMYDVGKLPAALRPTSCRLMDNGQLRLAQALKEDPSKSQLKAGVTSAALAVRGVNMKDAAAATLVFEGSRAEVTAQRRALNGPAKRAGGIWGGGAAGEAGYALTFAIAYLRDFGLDHRILSESLETMAPWSVIADVWPAVQKAVKAEHAAMRLPGRPFLSCRLTQIYDQGGVLYMYVGAYTGGLAPDKALEAFGRLEQIARRAAMEAGGSLSHHHGVGKHRAGLLAESQSPALNMALEGLKASLDPKNVLAAGNGAWSRTAASH